MRVRQGKIDTMQRKYGRPLVVTLPEVVEPHERQLPKTRGACPRDRPCPYLTCYYHLAGHVNSNGHYVKTFPSMEWYESPQSCALDYADEGSHTLQEVGLVMNIIRERVRQIEKEALKKYTAGMAAYNEG